MGKLLCLETVRIISSSSSPQEEMITIDPDGDLILRIGGEFESAGVQESGRDVTEDTSNDSTKATSNQTGHKACTSKGQDNPTL